MTFFRLRNPAFQALASVGASIAVALGLLVLSALLITHSGFSYPAQWLAAFVSAAVIAVLSLGTVRAVPEIMLSIADKRHARNVARWERQQREYPYFARFDSADDF